MEDRVKQILASGKLEEYVYGLLDPKDTEEVLGYIKKYPEVNKEYQTLQNQLEMVSFKLAKKPPIGMKAKIMDSLPEKSNTSSSVKVSWAKYAAILGLVASVMFAWAWKKLNDRLEEEKVKYATLASDCEESQKEIKTQAELIAFLNSAQTQRFDLEGNQLAPDFRAMVFVNETNGRGIVTPLKDVSLPKGKCLQLWGDLDGEMVPIAVLDNLSDKEYDITINPNFTSLNLTIEEKTADGKGQLHPDVSQLIASVLI